MRTIHSGWLCGAALAVAGLSTGCFQNKILVRVKPDGSGDILISRSLSAEVVQVIDEQLAQMRAALGGMQEDMPEDPFFNEEAIKREAARFGPDVKFVNARKRTTGGVRGSLAHFQFSDIRTVRITPNSYGLESMQMVMSPMNVSGLHDDDEAADADAVFSFGFEPGEVAHLTVRTPTFTAPPAPDAEPDAETLAEFQEGMQMWRMQMAGEKNPFGLTGNETVGEMIGKMYKGCEIELTVELVGEVVETDAKYRSSATHPRVTLLRVRPEMFARTKNPERVMMNSMEDQSSVSFIGAMIGLPESMVETNRAVSVRFK